MSTIRRTLLALLLPALAAAAAGASPARIAFLGIDNITTDARYDYLEGMIRGILLFDLSSAEGIEVVNRAELENILREQELQLSSLAERQQEALEVGRILGADYLLRGEYVFLGAEVLVTVSLIDVATARTTVYRQRGSGENTLHAVSEQMILRLTGREVRLQAEEQDRSIISLKDERPGSIALHSNLIDAEIFLDGEFAGYTTGDGRVPYVLDGLAPGPHTVRLHLSRFGVVKVPEITFHDWEEEVTVLSGKRHVVRAGAEHFNEIIYRMQQLVREDIRAGALEGGAEVVRAHDASFTDRQGRRVPVALEIRARERDGETAVEAVLTWEGEAHRYRLAAREGEYPELQEEVGPVRLDLEAEPGEVSYSVWRTDIHQNMDFE